MSIQSTSATERTQLSVAEAADFLGVSKDTIRRMIAAGELAAWRYGSKLIRIDVEALYKARRPVTPTAAHRAARTGGAQ